MTDPDALIGQTVSRYRIVEKLGGGGMGVVYKAEDTRLDRFVALKLLPEDVAQDHQALERFRREAKAASALESPEYLHDLRRRRGPPSIGRNSAASSGRNKRRQSLHRHGISRWRDAETPHRRAPDGSGIDSVAGHRDCRRAGRRSSPEQVRTKELDARTDLFSFGAVLYEMATGDRPFHGESSAVICEAIMNRVPAAVMRQNHDVPTKLEEIINRALEKDRNLRYQHASDMRAELQRLKRDTDAGRSGAVPAATSSEGQAVISSPKTSARAVSMASAAASSDTQVVVGLLARHKTALLAVIAGAVLILAGLGYGAYRWLSPGSGSAIDSLAVLPFANVSGDANTEYLSDGITESLIANLAHVTQLKVKSRNSVFRYKGKDIDLQRVGNDLGVSALVSGRVIPRGDNVEVSAELTDVRDNTEIWGQRYTGKGTEIISLEQRIAGDLADKLRSKLSTTEKQQVTRQGTQNPEAYELYLRGRYSWNKRTASDIATAISYFNQAIAKDPGYALAYSGLADAYGVLPGYGGPPNEDYPKSNAAARKALELDPTLARPHAVLGSNEMEYDWDSAGGEAELKKALELDSNDATAHHWYALNIGWIGGREQEALAEANRAHELDPLSPVINHLVELEHIFARRMTRALPFSSRSERRILHSPRGTIGYPFAYWAKRLYQQTIEEWRIFGQLSGDPNESDFASAIEQGFHSGGWKGALTKGIEARQAQRKTGYYSPYRIAELCADLGDKEQAFLWLNTAYQEATEVSCV